MWVGTTQTEAPQYLREAMSVRSIENNKYRSDNCTDAKDLDTEAS